MRDRFPMRAPAAIALTLLVGCGAATGSSPPGTAAPTTSTAPIETANAFQIEDTRRLLEQHLRAFGRQLVDPAQTMDVTDSPLSRVTDSEVAVFMVEDAERIVDFVEGEREWIAGVPSGECVALAMEAYAAALDVLDVVAERLFDAPSSPDAAKVRARAALADAATALAEAEDVLPESCA